MQNKEKTMEAHYRKIEIIISNIINKIAKDSDSYGCTDKLAKIHEKVFGLLTTQSFHPNTIIIGMKLMENILEKSYRLIDFPEISMSNETLNLDWVSENSVLRISVSQESIFAYADNGYKNYKKGRMITFKNTFKFEDADTVVSEINLFLCNLSKNK